ncbi:MAG: hypothetical protein R2774_03440 [Saprospiraceae bacterium]
MTSILKKNVFGFGAVFAFCATWEITDIFGFALITLICINLLWASFKLAEAIKLRNNIRQDNEVGNLIFEENYKPKSTGKVFTIEIIFPLYLFFKEHYIILPILIFSFFLLQEPFEKPYKNFALNLRGKQIEALLINNENLDDDQVATFRLNAATYWAYNKESEIKNNNQSVIVDYLSVNPKVNRFNKDYTEKSYYWFSIIIRLLLSTIFPLSILVNDRKN